MRGISFSLSHARGAKLQTLLPGKELAFDQVRFASQLSFDDQGQEAIADLPSRRSDQHAGCFLVQLDHLPEQLIALSVLESHLIANLQTVSVELARRAGNTDIRTIEIDVVKGDIP